MFFHVFYFDADLHHYGWEGSRLWCVITVLLAAGYFTAKRVAPEGKTDATVASLGDSWHVLWGAPLLVFCATSNVFRVPTLGQVQMLLMTALILLFLIRFSRRESLSYLGIAAILMAGAGNFIAYQSLGLFAVACYGILIVSFLERSFRSWLVLPLCVLVVLVLQDLKGSFRNKIQAIEDTGQTASFAGSVKMLQSVAGEAYSSDSLGRLQQEVKRVAEDDLFDQEDLVPAIFSIPVVGKIDIRRKHLSPRKQYQEEMTRPLMSEKCPLVVPGPDKIPHARFSQWNQMRALPGFALVERQVHRVANRLTDSSLDLVVWATPRCVPYWQGKTYSDFLARLVPGMFRTRILKGYWNEFGIVYGILFPGDRVTSVSFGPFAEAWMNFGPLAVVALSLFLGALLALAEGAAATGKLGNPSLVGACLLLIIVGGSNLSTIMHSLYTFVLAFCFWRFALAVTRRACQWVEDFGTLGASGGSSARFRLAAPYGGVHSSIHSFTSQGIDSRS